MGGGCVLLLLLLAPSPPSASFPPTPPLPPSPVLRLLTSVIVIAPRPTWPRRASEGLVGPPWSLGHSSTLRGVEMRRAGVCGAGRSPRREHQDDWGPGRADVLAQELQGGGQVPGELRDGEGRRRA
eukprot:2390796-Pyramimonas_sp.AAC.1